MIMRVFSALLIVALAIGSSNAQTATSSAGWPSKPIKLVVPFPGGSSTDVVARIVAQMLSPLIEQSFVIENRVGASGMIGAEAIARAEPDGYTIGVATTSTHALASSLSANLRYHPLRDFAPVSMIGSSPYVMVTHPRLQARSVQEFVALAKANPGKLSFGSAGPGSLAHLAGVLFSNMIGAQLIHVPYKSSAQSVTDLMTGRLDMQFATIPPTLPLIRSGQMQALATTGGKRSVVLPELPTIAETGLSGYEAVLWMAIVVPAAVPQPIIARLNRELAKVLDSPEAGAALKAQGMDIESSTPDALRDRIANDLEKWRSIVAQAGIAPE
jgi:tripartite-type tricarboxylate transporter receptor subunit TctC